MGAPLLFGSYINIPISALGQETAMTEREVTYFGMRYIVPVMVDSPSVILAVNVGGAVIPTLLSIYLLSKNRLWRRGLIAIVCVATTCHAFAQPVRSVGIALPIFVPPLVAAITAVDSRCADRVRRDGKPVSAGGPARRGEHRRAVPS